MTTNGGTLAYTFGIGIRSFAGSTDNSDPPDLVVGGCNEGSGNENGLLIGRGGRTLIEV